MKNLLQALMKKPQQKFTKTIDTPKGCYDINRRKVKAFVSIGKGHRASEMFCMALNMKPINVRTFQDNI